MQRSSRDGRAELLTARQAVPRDPWEGLSGWAGEGQGTVLEISVCKVQAAGQQENIRCGGGGVSIQSTGEV